MFKLIGGWTTLLMWRLQGVSIPWLYNILQPHTPGERNTDCMRFAKIDFEYFGKLMAMYMKVKHNPVLHTHTKNDL